MVLVNVLLLVGLAAAVLAITVAGDDAGLARATRMAEATQAQAIARGGELSAIVALRRDMVDAPDSDDASEPWAHISEAGTRIEGGRFALAVADATGKLDLNGLVKEDPILKGRVAAMAGALGLQRGAADRIADFLVTGGPIADLAELSGAGLAPEEIARLADYATVLPIRAPINLNAVSEPLLALLLDDPAAAHALVAVRARNGRLVREDFAAAGVAIPPGSGFVSQFYWSVARATVGGTNQQLTSLLERRKRDGAGSEVVAIQRWRGPGPVQAPVLRVRSASLFE